MLQHAAQAVAAAASETGPGKSYTRSMARLHSTISRQHRRDRCTGCSLEAFMLVAGEEEPVFGAALISESFLQHNSFVASVLSGADQLRGADACRCTCFLKATTVSNNISRTLDACGLLACCELIHRATCPEAAASKGRTIERDFAQAASSFCALSNAARTPIGAGLSCDGPCSQKKIFDWPLTGEQSADCYWKQNLN